MRNLTLAFCLSLPPSLLHAASVDTWCRPPEATYFSCTIVGSGKVVALCGTRQRESLTALQYRFGKLGHLELTFPTAHGTPSAHFRLSRYTRYQVTYLTVAFDNGDYTYELFSDYNGEGERPEQQRGIRVRHRRAHRTTEYTCQPPVEDRLGELDRWLPVVDP
ncbi:MAG: hypothetical protein HY696_11395 [Deltaproteobacteria bacterium]|nr:hypothetical protein [Deltaproteobacteria bacterium]